MKIGGCLVLDHSNRNRLHNKVLLGAVVDYMCFKVD